jgi:hypothetical protein
MIVTASRRQIGLRRSVNLAYRRLCHGEQGIVKYVLTKIKILFYKLMVSQNIVKSLFNDPDTNQTIRLGAINSINWSRILAQIVYYFRSYFLLVQTSSVNIGDKVKFVVPTGNFGVCQTCPKGFSPNCLCEDRMCWRAISQRRWASPWTS